MAAHKTKKPRCFLLNAFAPESVTAVEANERFNLFIADRTLPLALFHDHFIGRPGGIAIFFVESPAGQEALTNSKILNGWRVDLLPLIFSYSPAAFDEQINYTLKAYRDADWEALQKEKRPSYGNPAKEAETALEVESDSN